MYTYRGLKVITLSSLLTFSLCNPTLLPQEKIGACLAAAGVPYEVRSNTTWHVDILPFNQRLPYKPAAYIKPTTVEHIQSAVSCSAQHGLKVNAKCGGHSYASFGLGGEDGHLVIDLERINSVTVDAATNIATVGAGTRLGHLASQLFHLGGRAISHGTCPG